MDPRDLFKGGVTGSAESGYEDVTAAPFGMFKSNFFSRSQSSPQEEAGLVKQAFGEITLEGTSPRSPAESKQWGKETGRDSKTTSESDENPQKNPEEDSSPSGVPSYLAQLDVGLGSDLKIDSAFGSLARDRSEGDKDGQKEELQARKLPSMFGLGF